MKQNVLFLILILLLSSTTVVAEETTEYVEDCLLSGDIQTYDLQTKHGYRHREVQAVSFGQGQVQLNADRETHILSKGDKVEMGDVILEVTELINVDPNEGFGEDKVCFKLVYDVATTEVYDNYVPKDNVDLDDVTVELIYHDSDVVHVIAITNAALELDVQEVSYEYYSYEEFSPREVDQIYVLMGPELAKIVLPKSHSDAEEEIAHLIDVAVSSRLDPTIVVKEEISQSFIEDIIEEYEEDSKEKVEKENKDKELPEEEPKVECDGCVTDAGCVPKGIRHLVDVESFYCGLDGTSYLQKETGAECQNDFECKTNTCNSGQCIDLQAELQEQRSMLERILGWFGSWFS